MATHKFQGQVITLRDVLFPFLLVFCALVFIVFPVVFVSSRDDNNKGIQFLNDKDLPAAIPAFLRAIDKNYLHPAAFLNLALSRDLEKNPLKALEIYSFTAKTFKGPVLFYSHFNQGELQGRLGHRAKALTRYQAALEFSMEREKIKQNMEWLFLMPQNDQKKSGANHRDKSENENQESHSKDKSAGSANEEKNKDSSRSDGEQQQDQESQGVPSEDNTNTAGKEGKPEAEKSPDNQSLKQDHKNPSSGQSADFPDSKNQTKQNPKDLSSKEDQNTDSLNKETGRKEETTQTQDKEGQSVASTDKSQGAESKKGQNQEGKALDEIEAKVILDAIEKQESDIRKRLFQNRSRRRQKPGGKDW